jgi:hypothetical protein
MVPTSKGEAAEAAFGSYAVGGNAFSAGVTPPPGTYVSTVVGFYHADISGALPFHGIILNAGAKIDFFTSALAVLYVPDRKVLGAISDCLSAYPLATSILQPRSASDPYPCRAMWTAGVLGI